MERLAWRLSCRLIRDVAAERVPDLVVGADDPYGAYLRRWWLIPRNPIFNVYLHHFLRDDDDRALHDHPWPWASFLLRGSYIEHTIAAGGIHRRRRRNAGSIKLSTPWRAHRVELLPALGVVHVVNLSDISRRWRIPCWTLFITGPRLRIWGFHCTERGWVDHRDFTQAAIGKPGERGAGCDG
jgi:hypothetical protein